MKSANLAARYSREMRLRFGLWPSWLPDARVAIGDFGRIQQGVFVREGQVHDLGVSYGLAARQAFGDQLFASEGVRHAMLDGQVSERQTGAQAGARIEFGRGFGVFVGLRECHEERAADLISLADQLDRRRDAGVWSDDRCLVTGVVEARAALIAVSSDGGAALEVSATAPSPDLLTLLGGEVRIAREVSVGYRSLLTAGCTPLFRLVRLTRRGELMLRSRAGASPARLRELDARAGVSTRTRRVT